MNKPTPVELKREIGLKSFALNVINITIGAGIFVLPAIVAEKLGPASFIAYLLCGFLIILIMLCYAEIGTKITTSGGAYAYVETAFGPLAGFLINTLFWFSGVLSDAAVANAIVDMLQIWFPAFSETYVRVFIFIAIFGSFTLINIRGVKNGAQFNVGIAVLKLTPLIILVLIGLFYISPGNLAIKVLPNMKDIGEISLILFFAFMGAETSMTLGGEIKNPQKTIPRGIFMGVMGVLVIYLSIQFVAQGVMGNQLIRFKDAPISALAIELIGPIGGTIILITSVISMLGNLSGDILATPRILHAASRDKLLPEFLGRIHPKFATPHWSIIFYGIVIIIFSSAGGFQQLAVLTVSSTLIIDLGVVLAVIKLRFKKGNEVDGSFKIPGGLIIPILAIGAILWFLSHITKPQVEAMFVFFVIVTLFYLINKKFRKTNFKI